MDLITFPKTLKENFKKYRSVLIVILAGILLMTMPQGKEAAPPAKVQASEPDFQHALEEILGCIQGAGKVRLLLSREAGALTLYQSDESREGSTGGIRRDTVVVSDENRREQGLIRQVTAPRYRGAVVIAEGADSPTVALALKKAVASATGLGTDKITVLKMK